MGHGCSHRQYHAEAVEHGHLNHHPVCGGQIHAVADGLAIVDHVVVGEHNSLGEAGGAGGILHIAHVVLVDGAAPCLNLAVGNLFRQRHCLIPGVAARLLGVGGDDILEEGELLGFQLARRTGCQLRTKLLHDAHIVRILIAIDHDQSVGIGLAEQIFCLVDLVCGVDGYQHCADLGGCPEGNIPSRHIGCPDGNMIPLAHTHGDERPGKGIHIAAEFRICSGVVQLGVAKRVLGGEFLTHPVQHIREGVVNEPLLGPDILAGFPVVVLKRMLVLSAEGLHEFRILGEYHAGVQQIGHPELDPFQGDIAGILDGLQGFDHLLNGQITLAHHLVNHLAVFHHAVLGVDIFDALSQVCNCLFRGFSRKAVGVVHIPQCSNLVAAYAVQQCPEPAGIAVNAVGLHQQGDIILLRNGRQLSELLCNVSIIHLSVRGSLQIRQYADVGGIDLLCQLAIFCQFFNGFRFPFPVLQAAAGGKTGDFNIQRLQLCHGLGAVGLGEGHCLIGCKIIAHAPDLDAVKAQILCHGVNIYPGIVRTSDGGKTDLHN